MNRGHQAPEQSPPGPPHEGVIEATTIEGASLMRVPFIEYEHGTLSEIHNPGWASMYTEPIEHMYTIRNRSGARNEWHIHRQTTDRYLLLAGDIEIALHDGRAGSASNGETIRVHLTPVGKPGYQGLRIPPGVWHTFRSAEDGFLLLNNKFPKFNREDPDKFVVKFTESTIDFSWSE